MGDLLQPTHLLVIAIVLLVLFGGRRLPELGKGLGEGLRGFKEGLKGINDPVSPRQRCNRLPFPFRRRRPHRRLRQNKVYPAQRPRAEFRPGGLLWCEPCNAAMVLAVQCYGVAVIQKKRPVREHRPFFV